MSDKAQAPDYRATMFLPATGFPMKAGLPEAEPKWLSHWAEIDLYGKLRARAKGRPLFILHDGPIYANGDIHSGTGLNHILKAAGHLQLAELVRLEPFEVVMLVVEHRFQRLPARGKRHN